jgi:hypothetical protein
LQEAVDEVMQLMDEYFLSKDDWDAIVELGVGDNEMEAVLKKIDSKVKGSLTRKYVAVSSFPFFLSFPSTASVADGSIRSAGTTPATTPSPTTSRTVERASRRSLRRVEKHRISRRLSFVLLLPLPS